MSRPKGFKHSEETKQKIGKANSGKKGYIRKKGIKHSKESKLKMSESHKGLKRSEETKLKISLSTKGENNPNWRGGITPVNHIIRVSAEFQSWRKEVFERDNYTCQKCGIKNGNGKTINLNAHHLKSFAEYPELRSEIDNGITYCEDCHKVEGLHKGIKKLKLLTA